MRARSLGVFALIPGYYIGPLRAAVLENSDASASTRPVKPELVQVAASQCRSSSSRSCLSNFTEAFVNDVAPSRQPFDIFAEFVGVRHW